MFAELLDEITGVAPKTLPSPGRPEALDSP
jgi:hypothetical protein